MSITWSRPGILSIFYYIFHRYKQVVVEIYLHLKFSPYGTATTMAAITFAEFGESSSCTQHLLWRLLISMVTVTFEIAVWNRSADKRPNPSCKWHMQEILVHPTIFPCITCCNSYLLFWEMYPRNSSFLLLIIKQHIQIFFLSLQYCLICDSVHPENF